MTAFQMRDVNEDKTMLNKLQMQIKSYERRFGANRRKDILGTDSLECSDEKLRAYLEYLRGDDVDVETNHKSSESPEIPSTDIQEPTQSKTIIAAPTIQEIDEQEKQLDELLLKLRKVNRHYKIEWARKKNVPMKALLHAANLWLSDDTDDWTAAADTIFQFTSQFGNKQLCYQRSEKVAIPDI